MEDSQFFFVVQIFESRDMSVGHILGTPWCDISNMYVSMSERFVFYFGSDYRETWSWDDEYIYKLAWIVKEKELSGYAILLATS